VVSASGQAGSRGLPDARKVGGAILLIQVDNLIIPPPISAADYVRQLEAEGLGPEDVAALKAAREQGQGPEEAEDESAPPPEAGEVPLALQHLFKKHFRQGRFLMATDAQAAAARVIRDLGFAGFVNAPAAFVSTIAVREVDQMVLMQASALTEWYAEVDTPLGRVFGLHYPSSWINLPAPVEDPTENPVTAILKRIMLNSSPLAPIERHFPEPDSEIRWVTPKTQLRIDLEGEPAVTDIAQVIELGNTVTDRHLRIRRIAGGDLLLAEACRPLFPDFF
jgi:hypothetical protein